MERLDSLFCKMNSVDKNILFYSVLEEILSERNLPEQGLRQQINTLLDSRLLLTNELWKQYVNKYSNE